MKEMRQDYSNPWKGLESYTENDSHLFCGRDKEIRELTRLIEHHRIVTLYGRSGTGKTSLIKAGVFVRLKQIGDYSPAVIRLSKECDIKGKDSFAEYIKHVLDEIQSQSLPVIVLDQFEEVLRNNPKESVALLQWLRGYEKEIPNARFVISLREDDLYRLEDLLDRYHIDQMKENRYRLRDISEQGAEQVLMAVANSNGIKIESGLFNKLVEKFEKDDKERNGQSSDEKEVSTLLLSLCCNRMYRNMVKSDRKQKILTVKDLDALGDDPLYTYYCDATEGLSSYKLGVIEKMAPNGYRLPKSKKELINGLGEDTFKLLSSPESDRRIFTLSSKDYKGAKNDNDGNEENYELVHDRLAMSIYNESQRLRQERDKKMGKWGKWVFVAVCLLIIPMAAIVWFAQPLQRTLKHGEKVRLGLSLYKVPDGHLYLLEGDTVDVQAIDATDVHKITFRGGVLCGNINDKTFPNVDSVIIAKNGINILYSSSNSNELNLPNVRYINIEKLTEHVSGQIKAPKLERDGCIFPDDSNSRFRWSCGALFIRTHNFWRPFIIINNTIYDKADFPDGDHPNCTALLEYDLNNPLDTVNPQALYRITYRGNSISKSDVDPVRQRLYEVKIESDCKIEENAFANCPVLRKVTAGKVTEIPDWAFHGCGMLSDVDLSSATLVGQYAFRGNSALKSVKMPKIKKVKLFAFNGCVQLDSVDMPLVTVVENRAFNNSGIQTLNCPKLDSIGFSAFESCKRLERVSLPSYKGSSKSTRTFADCNCLTDVEMPSLTIVGSEMFTRCASLRSIELPQVKEIGSRAFERCYQLRQAIMPLSEEIGPSAFANCRLLSNVDFDSLRCLQEKVFDSCILLRSASFPNVKSVHGFALGNCISLKVVDLPQVESVGEVPFEKSWHIQYINMPKLKYVNAKGFLAYYLPDLRVLNIPRLESELTWEYSLFGYKNKMDLYIPQKMVDEDLASREKIKYHYNDTTYRLPESLLEEIRKETLNESDGYIVADNVLVILGDTINCLKVPSNLEEVVKCVEYPVIKKIEMTRVKIRGSKKMGYGSWFVRGKMLYAECDTQNVTIVPPNGNYIMSEARSLPRNTKVVVALSPDIAYVQLPPECTLLVPKGHRDRYTPYWPRVEEMSAWESWRHTSFLLFDFRFSVFELFGLIIELLYVVIIWFILLGREKWSKRWWMFLVLVTSFTVALIGGWQRWPLLKYTGYPLHNNMAELALVFCCLWTLWLAVIWSRNHKRETPYLLAILIEGLTTIFRLLKRLFPSPHKTNETKQKDA